MSRFLQRIVAGVHKPAGTVHPLLGSVYSRSTPEPLPEEENFAAERAEPVPPRARATDLPRAEEVSDRAPLRLAPIANVVIENPAPEPPSRPAPDTHLPSDPERRSAHDPTSAEVPARLTDFEPLIPPHTRSRIQTPLSEAQPSALRSDEPARADEPGSLRGDPVAPRDAASPKLPEPNRPLMSPLSSQPSRRTPKDDSPSGPAPDDIQIHIGRIEVTAAPPPVQNRAPAAPRRAGPSLDEYLKRRGGRR